MLKQKKQKCWFIRSWETESTGLDSGSSGSESVSLDASCWDSVFIFETDKWKW